MLTIALRRDGHTPSRKELPTGRWGKRWSWCYCSDYRSGRSNRWRWV